jgi:hypothetical protein
MQHRGRQAFSRGKLRQELDVCTRKRTRAVPGASSWHANVGVVSVRRCHSKIFHAIAALARL